jgi:dTDP-4-amino-4,6-dideoxygalactose transaminase
MSPVFRRQLPVASPLSAAMLAGALRDVASGRDRSDDVRAELRRRYGAETMFLTDSGTSALVLALRLVAHPGDVVAMPAYACVDLVAAARFADVRVALYDVDPHTLSPDLDSVRAVLASGPAAILVAQLYGYPADVPAVRALAEAAGARVIEDSAQHAGATLHGEPAGTTGDVVVLSFGRGKGTTGGRGGALLVRAPDLASRARDEIRLPQPSTGARDLVVATASWTLGRPSLYAVPSAVPWLHLGETVYHDAHEPEPMPRVAAALLTRTLAVADAATQRRRSNASTLLQAVRGARALRGIASIAGGEPGFLRLPVVADATTPRAPALGIVRGYPAPLADEPHIAPILEGRGDSYSGARELAAGLLTIPTHHYLTRRDLQAAAHWIRTA